MGVINKHFWTKIDVFRHFKTKTDKNRRFQTFSDNKKTDIIFRQKNRHFHTKAN